jgi:hypothetical protein
MSANRAARGTRLVLAAGCMGAARPPVVERISASPSFSKCCSSVAPPVVHRALLLFRVDDATATTRIGRNPERRTPLLLSARMIGREHRNLSHAHKCSLFQGNKLRVPVSIRLRRPCLAREGARLPGFSNLLRPGRPGAARLLLAGLRWSVGQSRVQSLASSRSVGPCIDHAARLWTLDSGLRTTAPDGADASRSPARRRGRPAAPSPRRTAGPRSAATAASRCC